MIEKLDKDICKELYTCIHCKKEQGSLVVNPYYKDTRGIKVWEVICPSCYNMLIQEI